MQLADPYVWIDPADAVFVASCREALKISRAAWEAADAERRQLRGRLATLGAAARAVSEDASPNSDGALALGDAAVDGQLILRLRQAVAGGDRP